MQPLLNNDPQRPSLVLVFSVREPGLLEQPFDLRLDRISTQSDILSEQDLREMLERPLVCRRAFCNFDRLGQEFVLRRPFRTRLADLHDEIHILPLW